MGCRWRDCPTIQDLGFNSKRKKTPKDPKDLTTITPKHVSRPAVHESGLAVNSEKSKTEKWFISQINNRKVKKFENKFIFYIDHCQILSNFSNFYANSNYRYHRYHFNFCCLIFVDFHRIHAEILRFIFIKNLKCYG